MIDYFKIDTQCIFDCLEDAEEFSILEEYVENKDIYSFQLNYLLINYLEDTLQFKYFANTDKLTVLLNYASKMNESIIFSMLNFIKTGFMNFEDLKSADVEDQIIFNRLINLAGGTINDFSIYLEAQRVIESCRNNNMFYNLNLDQYQR